VGGDGRQAQDRKGRTMAWKLPRNAMPHTARELGIDKGELWTDARDVRGERRV
jgi:hypothetical protein